MNNFQGHLAANQVTSFKELIKQQVD